jgi:hypothetical protein
MQILFQGLSFAVPLVDWQLSSKRKFVSTNHRTRFANPADFVCFASLSKLCHDENCRDSTIRKDHKGHEDRDLLVPSVFVSLWPLRIVIIRTGSLPMPRNDDKCRDSTVRKGHKERKDRNRGWTQIYADQMQSLRVSITTNGERRR